MPVSVSRSSNTGVSIETAPWDSKTPSISCRALFRIRIWSGRKSRVPFAILGLRRGALASAAVRRRARTAVRPGAVGERRAEGEEPELR